MGQETEGKAAELASMVGSRICHDLVNPLGALGNGLELLSMQNPALGEMAGLLAESLAAASARLQFFRIAFGATPAERMAEAEIARLVTDYAAGRRLKITWQAAGDRTRTETRLAFLLLLCLETAMPRGGRIGVTDEGGRLQIDAAADDMRHDTPHWAALRDSTPMPEATPALVQFPLAAAAMAQFPRPVAITLTPGQAMMRI